MNGSCPEFQAMFLYRDFALEFFQKHFLTLITQQTKCPSLLLYLEGGRNVTDRYLKNFKNRMPIDLKSQACGLVKKYIYNLGELTFNKNLSNYRDMM